MFILPAVKDHLSWETTNFSGRFTQVSLYWFHAGIGSEVIPW